MTFIETLGTVKGCLYAGCPYYLAPERDYNGIVIAVHCGLPAVGKPLANTNTKRIECPGKKYLKSVESRIQTLESLITGAESIGRPIGDKKEELQKLMELKAFMENL